MIRKSLLRAAGAVGLVALLIAGNGCRRASESVEENPALDGPSILMAARRRHREARSYADRGEFVVTYRLGGVPKRETHPLSAAYRTGGELNARLFNSSLICDGTQSVFAVNDPSTAHMDQQFVIGEMEDDWSFDRLYRDPIVAFFASGSGELPISAEAKKSPLEFMHPVLALIGLSSAPSWLGGAQSAERISDARIEGEDCYRIRVATEQGHFVAWVSQSSGLLRRLEFPHGLLHPNLNESNQVTELRWYIDLRDAVVDGTFEESAFDIRLPTAAKRVRHFVSLPEPFPSNLIGNTLPPFSLETVDRRRWDQTRLEGKITAFLWFSSEPVCRPVVEQFGEANQRARARDNVQFLAISADPPTSLSDVMLVQLLRDWQCPVTCLRGSRGVAQDSFDLQALPTVLVTDAEGTVQFYRVIENGRLADELMAVIDRLEQGDNIAAEMRDQYQRYLDEYRQQIERASVDRQPESGSEQLVSHPSQSSPARFSLEPIWSQNLLTAPGNVVHFRRGELDRFALLDGFRTIVELDRDGEVVKRVEVDLPAGVAITILKPIADGDRVMFAAGSILGSAVYILDDAFTVIASIPGPASEAAGIRDFQPMRSGNSPSLLVGYWEQHGIRAFDLEGEPIASSREIEQVNSVAPIGGSPPHVLAVDRQGTVYRFDAMLSNRTKVDFGVEDVSGMFAAPTSGTRDEAVFCALAAGPSQDLQVIGLTGDHRVTWNRTVAGGLFDDQTQFVSASRVGLTVNGRHESRLVWLVARPDGTIHFFDAQGLFFDRFSVEHPPTGLTLAETRSGAVLVVVSSGTIDAWRMGPIREISAVPQDGERIR